MADGTRSQDIKRIEDAMRSLKENTEKQVEAMVATVSGIKEMVCALNVKYNQIAEKVTPSCSTFDPTTND